MINPKIRTTKMIRVLLMISLNKRIRRMIRIRILMIKVQALI